MRLEELRQHVTSNYLSNQTISGREAKELVDLAAGEALTAQGKADLETLRAEFQDKFSAAGLRAFDRALAGAAANLPAPVATVGSGNTVMDVRLGRTLPPASRPISLAAVEDPQVRTALRRLDFNNDGVINTRDRDKMGFSDGQWRSFIYMATLLGQRVDSGVDKVPAHFAGKKVCFTAVPDKQKASEWARAMGAEVVSAVDADLDYLFVGFTGGTAKDERAQALNALGEAEIAVVDYAAFSERAHAVGVTGTAPPRLSDEQLRARINDDVTGWYESHIREHYEDELSEATTPEERARVETDIREELDLEAYWEYVGDDYGIYTDDLDPDGSDYADRLGVPIPNKDLVEVAVSFFPEYAGIGLGTYFLYDTRTGDRIDESEIYD